MPMEKTFNAAEAEARIADLWDAAGCFKAGAGADPGAETFCIMIPPPNVTGSLHMGHAFNNTLQDILTRWHRMRGHDTLWQPGTDHAGIATQMVVERELAKEGKRRTDFTRDDFLKLVWQQKVRSRGNIKGQLRRLGASCDWSREAFTMSGAPNAPAGEEGNFHDAVIRVFVDLYHKGLIYRGKRLVNWDPHFETAISDLEVEQVETAGAMHRLRYALADGLTYRHPVAFDDEGRATDWEDRDYLVVATTRPETMLGDTGIAVHPDDARYAHLIGHHVILPLVGRRIPIVADTYADPTKGTGAVKITPAHDFNDWDVGTRTGLRVVNVMDTRAAIKLADNPDFLDGADPTDDCMALHGLDRYAARRKVLDLAEAQGWLDGIDPDRHMVPHGDRSKVAIEPLLTDQWFVDTAKIVGPALDAVRNGDTVILPERDTKTYFHWLENIEPWCISRQLWWGHQIPVWYGLDLLPATFTDDEGDSALDLTEILRLLGEAGFVGREDRHHCAASFDGVADAFRTDLSALPAPLHAARIVEVADRAAAIDAFAAGLADYTVTQDPTRLVYPLWRDADVLDTWFSSGLWPIGTLGWPEQTPELARYFPTNVLVTGFDIIFFWVARMMMMQLAVVGQVPFRTVYVHPLVRDEKGKKMSKSLGNVLDPLDLIDEFGADAVRFTLAAMAAMGRDLKLSTQRIAGYRNFGTKLWNACRFAEMNGVWDAHATQATPPAPQATVNRWILGEAAKVRAEVDAALAEFRFDQAANALYAFVWGKVCDWYVEFAKPLFDGDQAAETRATMAFVLDQCMVLLHPFMPFMTEELWQTTGRRAGPLALHRWPALGADMVDAAADAEMGWVTGLIDEIRSARAQMRVPVGLKLDLVILSLDDAGRAALQRNDALIRRLARIETLTEAAQAPRGAVTIPVEGGLMALPLEGVIDVAEEKARLSKALEKLDKDMAGLRARLANPQFLAAAKEEVVDEARDKLEQGEDEAAKVRAALARLAAMT